MEAAMRGSEPSTRLIAKGADAATRPPPRQPLGLAALGTAVLFVAFLPVVAYLTQRPKSQKPTVAEDAPANDPLKVKSSLNIDKFYAMASLTATPEAGTVDPDFQALQDLKRKILRIAALTDRGQRHMKLVSDAMSDKAEEMKKLVEQLVDEHPCHITEDAVGGDWELVYSSVELFRSSPFFLAIEKALGEKEKSDLFFKLHLLQVGSWGVSTVGEVTQRIDFESQTLESDFDTTLFALTVIPIVGWFKLLPTIGGRVVTEAKNLKLEGDQLTMELERTRIREAPGIPFLPIGGGIIRDRWLPVNAVWQILPWNKEKPTCSVRLLYVDDDMRIVEDITGGIFIYMRPLL